MKRPLVLLLSLLALSGCRNPEEKRDYDAVRQRSAEQHQSHDQYKPE